jgi:hypothetical protein
MALPSRCPRCGGNQFRVRDQFGDYLSCLQCGRTVDVEMPGTLQAVVNQLDESELASPPRRRSLYARP